MENRHKDCVSMAELSTQLQEFRERDEKRHDELKKEQDAVQLLK